MKIGARIASLRRAKGFTQEQLAGLLGVSAPAVSKWETDTSYPDITLLCPLARALDTNVDMLLQFEEALSEEAVARQIRDVIETARQESREAAERMLTGLLRRYPNSLSLRFNAALVWDAFMLLFPDADGETRRGWTENKERLLAQVRACGDSVYGQHAALLLAASAAAQNRLEEAEALLRELPEHAVDATQIWCSIYLKKNEPLEALKRVQKRLYTLARQAQECMIAMLNPEMVPDAERALQICEAYRQLDMLFGLGGLYEGMFVEAYLRLERWEDAAESLYRYVCALTGEAAPPQKALFAPGIDAAKHSPASSPEMRRMLLRGLEEERCARLLQYPKGRAALEKLETSI